MAHSFLREAGSVLCPLQTPGWKECESGREAGAPCLLAVGSDSHPSALRTALSFPGKRNGGPSEQICHKGIFQG